MAASRNPMELAEIVSSSSFEELSKKQQQIDILTKERDNYKMKYEKNKRKVVELEDKVGTLTRTNESLVNR